MSLPHEWTPPNCPTGKAFEIMVKRASGWSVGLIAEELLTSVDYVKAVVRKWEPRLKEPDEWGNDRDWLPPGFVTLRSKGVKKGEIRAQRELERADEEARPWIRADWVPPDLREDSG